MTQPARPSRSRRQHVLRTPSIEVAIHRENGRLFAQGTDVRAVVLNSPETPSVPLLKRSIEGRVGDRLLRIHRPATSSLIFYLSL